MAQRSVWKVKFHIGPSGASHYTTFIGISGGSRKDGQTPSAAASILTAIQNNLLNIIKEMTTCSGQALTAAPGGTVVIDSFEAASVPDCWE
jgi:hypothetical protein